MDCLNPVLIDNPDYLQSYDTFGRSKISVPCGKCSVCIVNNAQEWRTRLEIEWNESSSAHFITLTYDESHIPYVRYSDTTSTPIDVPCVSKRDVQLFLKRLRKRFSECRIRYFFVSEYGPSTFRPHYHAILFGLPRLSDDRLVNECKLNQEIQKLWHNGLTKLDAVTYGRISYVTKYLSCVTYIPDYLPRPFV